MTVNNTGEQKVQKGVGKVFESRVLMVQCGRCGHQWMPRTDVAAGVLPKACPACFSHFWNEPYANQVEGGPPPTKPRKTRSDKGTSRGPRGSRRSKGKEEDT